MISFPFPDNERVQSRFVLSFFHRVNASLLVVALEGAGAVLLVGIFETQINDLPDFLQVKVSLLTITCAFTFGQEFPFFADAQTELEGTKVKARTSTIWNNPVFRIPNGIRSS